MVDGFSCILDFPKFSVGGPPDPPYMESTPPLKQSTRNLPLGYTEIEKRRRALGQYLFCVICNWAVWHFDLCYLISSLSLNLGGRRGTTDDVATLPFHPSMSSAALRDPNPIPVHSLMLSSHLFFCLPLLLAPFTVPCRIIFAMPEDLEMWPYHLRFRFFTMVRRSSCIPIAFWILLRTSPFITWSL